MCSDVISCHVIWCDVISCHVIWCGWQAGAPMRRTCLTWWPYTTPSTSARGSRSWTGRPFTPGVPPHPPRPPHTAHCSCCVFLSFFRSFFLPSRLSCSSSPPLTRSFSPLPLSLLLSLPLSFFSPLLFVSACTCSQSMPASQTAAFSGTPHRFQPISASEALLLRVSALPFS